MPQYEFVCNSCKNVFSKQLTLAEYEEGEVVPTENSIVVGKGRSVRGRQEGMKFVVD